MRSSEKYDTEILREEELDPRRRRIKVCDHFSEYALDVGNDACETLKTMIYMTYTKASRAALAGARGRNLLIGVLDTRRTVAQFLKDRITAEHTVTDAAKLLGVGRPGLSSVLHGHSALSPQLAFKIERVFGINARDLLHNQLNEEIECHLKKS